MADEERVSVKTYLPRHQKELWAAHADELEMSQSEFVRSMVQAGRADFDVPKLDGDENSKSDEEDSSFEPRILSAIEREGALDWDELVSALIDDVEGDLDAALQQLQDENQIRYSGRDGGYVLANYE